MDKIEIIGFIACSLTTSATIPQIIKIIKTRQVNDLSVAMSAMFCLGFIMWIIYGVIIESASLIVGNCISIIFYSIILLLTLLWKKK